MTLDQPREVLTWLNSMKMAGGHAHRAASEDGGLTGPIRDLLYGINTAVDALMALVEEQR